MSATHSGTDALLESFDMGDDTDGYFNFEHPKFPKRKSKRVNVDFPGVDDYGARQ